MDGRDDLGRILAVSPHLDDGVFSCGELLSMSSSAVMVTVFAGVPSVDDQLTAWDAACGFRSARQAMVLRRAEDRAALGILGVQPCWLDFTDSQYQCVYDVDDIADALCQAVCEHRSDSIIVPSIAIMRWHTAPRCVCYSMISCTRGLPMKTPCIALSQDCSNNDYAISPTWVSAQPRSGFGRIVSNQSIVRCSVMRANYAALPRRAGPHRPKGLLSIAI